MEFPQFFERATKRAPYPYQVRVAAQGLPDVLQAPTGAGKTEAIVVPWLWRAFYGSDEIKAATPRRLVVALPLRTLVEQTEERIMAMLANAELRDEVVLRVLMGGRMTGEAMAQWRTQPQQHSIVVGTIDSVVSRALNRGYGQSRGSYPIDFALITNGAHLVVDEVQLSVQATATLRQISAFQQGWRTAEPVGLTCVSATVLPEALDVVDNPYDRATTTSIGLEGPDEANKALAERLRATKTVRQLTDCSTPKALATQILAQHVPGTLTLVMVNTVKQAVETFRALRRASGIEALLVHSHFRGVERAAIVDRITSPLPEAGRIVVSTQSLEAGVDLDARTMITEAAPWSSLVQRSGRCNRTGGQTDAQLLWLAEGAKGPYPAEDLAATAGALAALEGQRVTARDLQATPVDQTPAELSIIRRSDLLDLFETAADQAGRDIDVSAYIRSHEPLDVQVAWVDTDAYRNDKRLPVPEERWRCSVSLKDITAFLGRNPQPRVLAFDAFADRWQRISARRVRPQQLLLIDAADGGYDAELGFTVSAKAPVLIQDDTNLSTQQIDGQGMGGDPSAQLGEWVSLQTHLDETRAEAHHLVEAISATTALEPNFGAAVIGAAALHDLGKAHDIWQAAVTAVGEPPATGGPWAKSGGRGTLRFQDEDGVTRPNFRHELVSALLLMTPGGEQAMGELGLPTDQFDLCRYLVAAHHGHVRIHPQDPRSEGTAGQFLLGVANGDSLPSLLGPSEPIELNQRFGGGPDSWTAMSLQLLDEWGPFRLAYAEMLVRMADWRASALTHQEQS